MYISRFEICNFKSYFRSNPLELEPGLNIITGQNNAGKTAFLDALSLRFTCDPHRSLRTMPNVGVRPAPVSCVDISFVISSAALHQILEIPEAEYYIAAPVIGATSGSDNDAVTSQQAFADWLLSRDNYTFRLRMEKRGGQEQWVVPQAPSLGLYQPREAYGQGQREFIRIRFAGQRFVPIGGGVVGTDENREFGVAIASSLVGRIYRFTAERFNMAVRPFGASTVLNADASNLPEVLNTIQGH